MEKIVVFELGGAEPRVDYPRAERLVSEHSPLRQTWDLYVRQGISAGVWACEPGAWRISFEPGTDEFFHVLSGRIRITDLDNRSCEFGPGSSCLIPGGFQGLFEVLEHVTKHYVFVSRG